MTLNIDFPQMTFTQEKRVLWQQIRLSFIRIIIISAIFWRLNCIKKCMKMMHEIIYNCFCKSKLKIMMQKMDATKNDMVSDCE